MPTSRLLIGETSLHVPASADIEVMEFRSDATGPLGPVVMDSEGCRTVLQAVVDGELDRRPSDEYTCDDARPNSDEDQYAEINAAPLRLFGGRIMNAVGTDLLLSNQSRIVIASGGLTLEEHVALQTQRIIEAEGPGAAAIHGDNHGQHQKAGCGANAVLIPSLQRHGEDALFTSDVVTNARNILSIIGIGISHPRLRDMTSLAAERAHQSGYLQDSTPESRVDTVVANGGVYEVRDGQHSEVLWVVNAGDAALATRRLARDHGVQAFASTLGAAAERTRRLRHAYGLNRHTVEDRVAAMVLTDVTVGVHARNSGLPGFVINHSVAA